MNLEDLPGDFVAPTRDRIAERYRRDYKIRLPTAKTGAGTLAYIDSLVQADTLLPVYADAVAAANNTTLENATLEGLKEKAVARGLPAQLPAAGGTGFVIIGASVGGVFIAEGREIRHDASGMRFECSVGATYFDKQPVPVRGVDVGPATNIAAGAAMRWDAPPPGLNELATVQARSDGRGLTGGRTEEQADGIRRRIQDHDQRRPAAGNNAEIRRLAKKAADALGIPIEEAFVYSIIAGPGSYAYVFTLRPGEPGTSRAPSSTDIAAIRAYIKGELPDDDGIFAASIVDVALTVKLEIIWAKGAHGWIDQVPYPAYSGVTPAKVTVVTSTTAFRVLSLDTPGVGKTIAFYNATTGTFVFKRILTATSVGGNQYDIVCDTTNGASDTAYLPSVNEEFCPWSKSLDLLVSPTIAGVDALGPGEQFDEEDFFDEDGQQRRDPPTPDVWPAVLTNRVIDPIFDVSAVSSVEILSPDVPYAVPTGVPTVSSNLLKLTRLLAFPA